MKKLFAIIFIFILTVRNSNTNSYAEECIIPSIDVSEINFSNIANEKRTTDTHFFKDKIIEVVSYKDITKLDKILGEKMQDAALKLVKSWSNKIDLKNAVKIAQYLKERTLNYAAPPEIVAKKMDALRSLTKNAYLLEDEQVEAQLTTIDKAFEFSNQATNVVGTASAGIGLLTTGLIWYGKILTFFPSVIVGAAATMLALGTFTAIYNKVIDSVYEAPALENLRRTMNLIIRVGDEIFNHNWIDNNVLVMATSRISGCEKTDVQFKNVDEIKYNNPKAINNWFAQTKCKFINDNSKACWQDVLEEIKCLSYDKENLLCLKYHAISADKYLTNEKQPQTE